MDFLQTFFAPFDINESWYPVILVGLIFLCLLVIYIGFIFIRSFLSWLWRMDELVRETQETNALLTEILTLLEGTRYRDSEMLAFLQKNDSDRTTSDGSPTANTVIENDGEATRRPPKKTKSKPKA